eukprot:CAMPEP_0119134754 /NCGR_PEP_ID=MMETSP1310-20130426/17738_1 /TAXON_ID=464262 /ORGANISM="Genus nov. species nov., Strain RCC2339" /LENGTH=207 /DNA_ID=CAMNT_0007125581 /DNA_START=50 /DNA_END=673 /DNA_ORIENTATION=+
MDNDELVSVVKELQTQVRTLSEIQNVKDFMAVWALKLDLIEFLKDESQARLTVNSFMTATGTFDMPFGVWGPDKEAIVKSFLAFAKDPDAEPGKEPSVEALGIGWAVHLYFHQTVRVTPWGDTGLEASFKARELVPLLWNGKAKWLLLDNDSVLRKEKGGDWLMHRYGLKAFNLLSNEDAKWAALQGRAGNNEMFEIEKLEKFASAF